MLVVVLRMSPSKRSRLRLPKSEADGIKPTMTSRLLLLSFCNVWASETECPNPLLPFPVIIAIGCHAEQVEDVFPLSGCVPFVNINCLPIPQSRRISLITLVIGFSRIRKFYFFVKIFFVHNCHISHRTAISLFGD